MNKDLHKIYQIMDFFVSENSYANIYLGDLMKPGVIWLYNADNPDFQLIRLSNTSIDYFAKDDDNLQTFLNDFALKNHLDAQNFHFLDIHICKNSVTNDSFYSKASIDTNFHSGIDLDYIYPGIYDVISEVEDQESELKKRINRINESMKRKQQNFKNNNVISRFKVSSFLVTFIVCVLCLILYLFTFILSTKYDNSSVLVFLGADYKMFTLGLEQFYRLITGAFLHGSFIHLFCNVISMFSIGSIVEQVLGRGKYLIMLLCGIIVSSLAHGVMSGNSLVCGLSGGIYCLFAYFIIYLVKDYKMPISRFMPTIFINLIINFLPNVSWVSHLGGAICGILFYYIYQDNKIDFKIFPVIIILIGALFFKFVKDNNIQPYFAGTDLQAVEIARDLGFENYANKTEIKLYEIYTGGMK